MKPRMYFILRTQDAPVTANDVALHPYHAFY